MGVVTATHNSWTVGVHLRVRPLWADTCSPYNGNNLLVCRHIAMKYRRRSGGPGNGAGSASQTANGNPGKKKGGVRFSTQ